MMNRFVYFLAQNGHLTFNQKSRSVLLQIFGHEALFPVKDLRHNSHCDCFNIDLYRVGKLRREHFALRKILNPFKWLEFLAVFPVEIIRWSFARFPLFILNKMGARSALSVFGFCLNIFYHFFINPLLSVTIDIPLAILRRFIAPSRYIIRPAIQLAKMHPKACLSIVLATVLMTGLFAAFIFTGGLPIIPLVLGSAAAVISVKVLLTGMTAVAVFALLEKSWFGLKELISAGRMSLDRQCHCPYCHQKYNVFTTESTTRITEQLHGLAPECAEVKRVDQQNCYYSFALFTGTESLFYKPVPLLTPELVPMYKLRKIHRKQVFDVLLTYGCPLRESASKYIAEYRTSISFDQI